MCLAIPGEVVAVDPARPELATVSVGGVRRAVNVSLLADEADGGPVRAGDWVLIHVGFAMSRIDEAEAAVQLDYLRGMAQAYDDELAALASSEFD